MTSQHRRDRDHVARLDSPRGRKAPSPLGLGLRGWRDALWRASLAVQRHNISLLAAGVAFYGMFTVAPALSAIVAVYGLFFDPRDAAAQIDAVSTYLPRGSEEVIRGQLQTVTTRGAGALGLGAVIGFLVAVYGSTRGVVAVMAALNVAYAEYEKRGIVRYYATAYALTACAILLMVVSLGAIVLVPAVLTLVGFGGLTERLVALARWPVLAALFAAALAVLYRYGPSRSRAEWRWVMPGALIATFLWLLGSGAFSLYVRYVAAYSETYGSLGAVFVLLMWFWLSAFIVLVGAEINAEAEHQTLRDTTAGPERPLGRRGATVADRVGRRP